MVTDSAGNEQKLIDVICIASGDEGVLVGGMAVEIWRQHYGIESELASLTTDIDYFADRSFLADSVKRIRKSGIRAAEFLSSMDEATPNSGKIAVYDLAPQPIQIDCLYAVGNLSNDDIEGRAITVQINGKDVRIANPLILMEMKIGNLYSYPTKRDLAGREQARISVMVASRFLPEASNQRDLLDAVERIIRFSGRDPACYARHLFNIDAMSCITPAVIERCGEAFQSARLPQVKEWIRERQKRFDNMLSRITTRGLKPAEMRF
jgi:hypothetical protein